MLTLFYNLFTRSLLVLLVAMLSVNYLPEKLFDDFPFEPKATETLDFDSVIPNWNTDLSSLKAQPEYIQLNNIRGPESIAQSNDGLIYTGLADGRIVELDPSKGYKLRTVLKFNNLPVCKENVVSRAECGRFLQLRFVNSTLYAIEPKTGLFKIDIKSGTKSFLGPKASAGGVIFYNSFVFDPKDPNIVYVTISSKKWDLTNIIWSFIELESSGQLVALDTKTGKQVVVLDNLSTTNGCDIDVKRDQLLFSETTSARVSSVSLKDIRAAFKTAKDGDKLSIKEKTLIPLTPGNPDNIVISGDLAYIALPFVKPSGKQLVDHLSTMPNVRKAYGRFMYGVGKLLGYICENYFYHPLLDTTYRELLSGHINYRLMQTDKCGVIEYNLATGSSRFLGSDTFSFVSEAVPDNKGNLLLGSFRSPFIVKVKLTK